VPDSAIDTRIGAGSDYTPFLNFVGVPIVDMRFRDRTAYHSVYDTHDWVPDSPILAFFTTRSSRIWTSLATRLANTDLLPLDQCDTHAASAISSLRSKNVGGATRRRLQCPGPF
jgi:hypothetical protein